MVRSRRLLPALLLPLLAAGCGVPVLPAGPRVTEQREVPDGVTSLRLAGRGTVELTEGPPGLEVIGGRELVEDVEVRADGDELVLFLDHRGPLSPRGELVYRLSLPEWDGIRVSGSGTVLAPQDAGGGSLRVDVSGSGEVVAGDVDREDVLVDVTGSGEVRLYGRAEALGVVVSGSGEVEGAELSARDVVVDVSGSGDVEVHAADSLAVDVSGSGDVEWSGDASDVRTDVSGSGDVTRR